MRLLSGFVLCFVVGFIIPDVVAQVWYIETVDSGGDVGWSTCLALDSSGTPHISYYDHGGKNLKYASWNGSFWDIVTVEASGDVGVYNSLALDSSGNPHIAYLENTDDDDLKYASWNGSFWEIEYVDSSAGNVGYNPSLVIDSSDYPHIAYCDYSNGDLKYAGWNGNDWIIGVADTAGFVGVDASLALDTSGYPHISHFHNNYGNLLYTEWDGSDWTTETVDGMGVVGSYTSLALDSEGKARISYYDLDNEDLNYASWNGSSWDLEILDMTDIVGLYTSLALDSSDFPHISYYDATNSSLKYANWNGSTWEIESVESDTGIGAYTSLELDSSNNPHISYMDVLNNDLKYAWFNTPPPAFSLLSPSNGEIVYDWPLADWEDAPDYPEVVYDLWYSTEPDFTSYEEINDLNDSYYQFTDTELDPDSTYYWKVRAWDGYVETWSTETWSFITDHDVHIGEMATSDNIGLLSVRPNPAFGHVALVIELPESREVKISIFDLAGRLVESVNKQYEAGIHELVLNEISSGIYFIRMITDDYSNTQRFIMIEQHTPDALNNRKQNRSRVISDLELMFNCS